MLKSQLYSLKIIIFVKWHSENISCGKKQKKKKKDFIDNKLVRNFLAMY